MPEAGDRNSRSKINPTVFVALLLVMAVALSIAAAGVVVASVASTLDLDRAMCWWRHGHWRAGGLLPGAAGEDLGPARGDAGDVP